MSNESEFPKPVSEVRATLAGIFRHQGGNEILELLESSHARFDETNYDNWNGGTYTWALRLEVPVSIYAAIETRLPVIEKEIGTKLSYLDRLYPNDQIGAVTITPIAPGISVLGERMAPSEVEIRHLWDKEGIRLFLSHSSNHKIAVAKLKSALSSYGAVSFVAHVDIDPSLEWLKEIELGLQSMHALVALITPEFHTSLWTDQEIGWALGRGIAVLSVRSGADPYGFAGKYQAVPGSLEEPDALALSIVNVLLTSTRTHGEMRRSLVKAFSVSRSYTMAISLKNLLVEITDFTDEEKEVLRKTCTENSQVAGAFGVSNAIYATFGKTPDPEPETVEDEIPF